MATGQILGLFMLACISTAARVHDVAVPNLLLDIYHTGMVAKCKLGKVAASMPTSFKAEKGNYLKLTYNVSAYAPHSAAHLVFQLDSSSINAIPCKSFKASLNGSSITLHNRLVNTSLVAKLDHAELHRSAEIRLDTEQLSRCGVQVNEIFLLSNVNETCTVWAQLMSPTGGRFSRSIDAAKEKATDQDPPPSTKLPKFASVLSRVITWPLAKQAIRRDTRVRNRCERKDFIVSFDELSSSPNYVTIPDTFNMGMCKGMCTTIQCKNNNAFLRGLINDIFKDDKAAPKELPEPPACRPTKYENLQVIVSLGDRSGFEVRVLKDMVVAECGCV